MNQFLSATRSGRAIAALATAEGRVSSWSVEPLRKLAEFDTIFGGVLGKLAIGSASGRSVVVAAAFWRGAVSGYDADAGDLIWERRDTREVRHLAAVSEGRHIAAAFGRGPMQILDVLSGQTVATGRGVRATYGGSDPALAIAAFDGRVALAQVNPWQELTRLDVARSGVLDAEFAADAVLVSAVHDRDVGPSAVYAFSRYGDIRWRHEARHGWKCRGWGGTVDLGNGLASSTTRSGRSTRAHPVERRRRDRDDDTPP